MEFLKEFKVIGLKEYKSFVKEQRSSTLISPNELTNRSFMELDYQKQNEDFFSNNASAIIEALRISNWDLYLGIETSFTQMMLKHLIENDNHISNLNGKDAAIFFAEEYPEHIYNLALSNTQSRRSRAGKEFESIIEVVLLGAGIRLDSQGKIGKELFSNKGLGKLVDLVTPGVVEFSINKNNTALISAKTTLRERWQEVPEEMSRTGASKMYLATLDECITKDTLKNIYEQNIVIVTTKNNKENYYPNDNNVITFERLIKNCKFIEDEWNDYHYSEKEVDLIKKHLIQQCNKSGSNRFIIERYQGFINNIDR